MLTSTNFQIILREISDYCNGCVKGSNARKEDENTPTSSCVVASMDDDCYITGIREEVIHLTHFDLDGQWFLVGILGVKLTANNATIQP